MSSRWRLQASNGNGEVQLQVNEEQEKINFSDNDVVHCPPVSKTIGPPKRRRIEGGKELSQDKNACGLCKGVGHNVTTCMSSKRKYSTSCSQKKLEEKNLWRSKFKSYISSKILGNLFFIFYIKSFKIFVLYTFGLCLFVN